MSSIKTMYRNPDWLKTQYCDARKSIRALSKECGVSEATISKYLCQYKIPIIEYEMPKIGDPVWQGYIIGPPAIKKNSQTYNSSTKFPVKNPKFQAYWYNAIRYIEQQSSLSKPLDGNFILHFYFFVDTRRTVDISNLYEAPQDVLVRCGVISDDNSRIIVGHDFSRVIYDKENPRTEIRLYDFSKYDKEAIDELVRFERTNFYKGRKEFFIQTDKVVQENS